MQATNSVDSLIVQIQDRGFWVCLYPHHEPMLATATKYQTGSVFGYGTSIKEALESVHRQIMEDSR